MNDDVIELLETIFLEKENHAPLVFEAGTILKIVMKTQHGYLVMDDRHFTFTIRHEEQDRIWQLI